MTDATPTDAAVADAISADAEPAPASEPSADRDASREAEPTTPRKRAPRKRSTKAGGATAAAPKRRSRRKAAEAKADAAEDELRVSVAETPAPTVAARTPVYAVSFDTDLTPYFEAIGSPGAPEAPVATDAPAAEPIAAAASEAVAEATEAGGLKAALAAAAAAVSEASQERAAEDAEDAVESAAAEGAVCGPAAAEVATEIETAPEAASEAAVVESVAAEGAPFVETTLEALLGDLRRSLDAEKVEPELVARAVESVETDGSEIAAPVAEERVVEATVSDAPTETKIEMKIEAEELTPAAEVAPAQEIEASRASAVATLSVGIATAERAELGVVAAEVDGRMGLVFDPQRSEVMRAIARQSGCAPEDVAITAIDWYVDALLGDAVASA